MSQLDTKSAIENIINAFPTISLTKIKRVALMNRIDTKFIINQEDLPSILDEVREYYEVLEMNDKRILPYDSIYFDTKNKIFYHDHHNGKTQRIKIRIRKYVESNHCFLEVKQKNAKGKTNKSRVPLSDFQTNLTETSLDFVRRITHKHYDLSPVIGIRFNRITLAHNTEKERATIDLNLCYQINDCTKSYENLVIIEIKQEHYNRNSQMFTALKKHRYYPYRISKYCIGMITLYQNLKYNAFKRKLLKVRKVTG